MMKRIKCILLLCFIIPFYGMASDVDPILKKSIDSLLNSGLKAGYYPGASIAVGNSKGIVYESTYGYRDTTKIEKVKGEDVYDIASLTKVVSTTFAVMALYDRAQISLDKKVGDYIDCYRNTPVNNITVQELLTHTSGLPYFPAYSLLFANNQGGSLISSKQSDNYPYAVDKGCYLCSEPIGHPDFVSPVPVENYRQAGENLYIHPAVDSLITSRIVKSYNPSKRGTYLYTDTNFYILRQIIEKISGTTIDQYTRRLFDEMGMNNTGYNPLVWKEPENIIPTEYDYLMQRGQIRGFAHDDLAAVSGNVEGNAGLFSTANDLARFCEMLLGKGEFRDKRIISDKTVKLFTDSPLKANGIYRGLGFDKRGPSSPLYGGYGHTGYTGTMIWIDEKRDIFMVFLSNRVHPTRLNNGLINSNLRVKLWEILKKNMKQ